MYIAFLAAVLIISPVLAKNSQHFLAEFLEVGGMLTVLEVVGLRGGSDADKKEALTLLTSIANKGRQYKELLCESYGEYQYTS